MSADIEEKMFCFQCEQTFKGTGCVKAGVCSKSSVVSRLQDQLICCIKSLCAVCNAIYKRGDAKEVPEELEKLIPVAMFSTMTNVNFTEDDVLSYATEVLRYRDDLAKRLTAEERATIPAKWLGWTLQSGKVDAEQISEHAFDKETLAMIPERVEKYGKDISYLQEIITYGVKGGCAYVHHANVLGVKTTSVTKEFVRLLGDVLTDETLGYEDLLGECLACGRACYECMTLLDKGNTETYGHPEPTTVQWIKDPAEGSAEPGKAILVSGHDLAELGALLEQTAGKGINVYTHGEMLPALAYPGLKKFPHLAGHYGTAWQNQRTEFAKFPGPVVLTTNCYVPALPSYQENVFACVPVNGKGVRQVICNKDYSSVIARANELPGFQAPKKKEPAHSLLIGFGHHAVVDTPVLDLILDAITHKKLSHVYLIGGCDGYEKERNQYTELAEKLPQDTLIITLACGKFKINGADYGKVPGTELPRLVDMGQCNDAYSAIQVVLALCKKLGVQDPNILPITYVLSWFEQKAIAVLLALLSLGIKDIYIGPKVPAFVDGKLAEILHLHPFESADSILKKRML